MNHSVSTKCLYISPLPLPLQIIFEFHYKKHYNMLNMFVLLYYKKQGGV